jgi:ribosome-binding factor A
VASCATTTAWIPASSSAPPAAAAASARRGSFFSQVAQALAQILASEFDDDLLLGLTVLAVEPAPNESQLLVILQYDQADPAAGDEVLQRLSQATGFLRSQIAAAITRKRAPQLMFRLVPVVAARSCRPSDPSSSG